MSENWAHGVLDRREKEFQTSGIAEEAGSRQEK